MRPYSYSRISTYYQCPLKFKLHYIEKLGGRQEDSPALKRGNFIHDSLESFINRESDVLPDNVFYLQEYLEGLRDRQAIRSEVAFGLNDRFEPCDYDGDDVFIRGFVDALIGPPVDLRALEWKTGKEYASHAEQRALYGLWLLVDNPDQEKATVTGVYVDEERNVDSVFERAALVSYKWHWEKKIDRIESDQSYAPRPGFYCRWCPYSRHKEGPCPVA